MSTEPSIEQGGIRTALSQMPAFLVSFLVHAAILAILISIPVFVDSGAVELALESIMSEELKQDPNQQLEVETEIATTLNVVPGGTVSTEVGAAQQPQVSKIRITESKVMQEPTINAVVADMSLPSDSLIGDDLGEGQVTGQVGAIVEGYGAALGRITQELLRIMREQRVLVVWLFDESESMKDDREEIAQKFDKVYQELGIASKKDKKLRKGKEVLQTVIASYGNDIHEWTKEPTEDIKLVREAIAKVPIDTSGEERMCQSIRDVIRKYRTRANRAKRKLVVIVVSDESGDDGQYLEEAVAEAKRTKAPVYVLGRESVFGYPYARQRWTDPVTKLSFWPRVRRGPETAFPECLQWNGLHARWDAYSAGFGAYEQVRLCRESGGIFFALPGEEKNLAGRGALDKRVYEFLAMKEYTPLLLPRKIYVQERSKSKFRTVLWNVIAELNPQKNELLFDSHDPQLNIRQEHYPLDINEFKEEAAKQVLKAVRAMTILNDQAIPLMESIKPLRATEPSQRWRAAYDLAYAQLTVFRLRLYQYLLAMDDHVHKNPQTKKKESNEWNVWWSRQIILPDEAQFERLKTAFNLKLTREEYLQMVKDETARAKELLQLVSDQHPETPWAQRAQRELRDGFGMKFSERFWDPRYSSSNVKVPKL